VSGVVSGVGWSGGVSGVSGVEWSGVVGVEWSGGCGEWCEWSEWWDEWGELDRGIDIYIHRWEKKF